jgi:hypothetical protein
LSLCFVFLAKNVHHVRQSFSIRIKVQALRQSTSHQLETRNLNLKLSFIRDR